MTRLSRRDVLAGLAAAAGPLTGRVAAGTADTQQYTVVVGPDGDPSAVEDAATDHTRTVPLGDVTLVAGAYTPDTADALRDRAGVKAVERDQGVSVPPQPSPPDKGDGPPAQSAGPAALGPDANLDRGGQVTDWGFDLLGGHGLAAEGIDGSGATIAVLDSGFDLSHPDFDGAVAETAVFDGTDITDETHEHGTPVAGVVGARDNGAGTVGIAPGADLALGKIGDRLARPSAIADGMRWAVDQAGADVISVSYIGRTSSTAQLYAARYAAANGVLVVASAGNYGYCRECVGYPAAFPSVLGVGSLHRLRTMANHSARGPHLDLIAPGEAVSAPARGGGRHDWLMGTSFAAPYVAGTAGLLYAQGKDRSAVIDTLRSTAVDIGEPETEQGAGRVDAWNAATGRGPVELVNTETGAGEGMVSDFDVRVRANTIRETDDWEGPADIDPYFEVYLPADRLDGDHGVERIWMPAAEEAREMVRVGQSDALPAGYDTRVTVEVASSALDRIAEGGEIDVLVVLRDEDWGWLHDDEFDRWWVTAPYAASRVDRGEGTQASWDEAAPCGR